MFLRIYFSIILSLPVHSFFESEVDLEPINRTLLTQIGDCSYNEAQEFQCNTMDGIPEESRRNTLGFWHSCSFNCEFRHFKQPSTIEASRIIIEAYHHGIDTEIRVVASYDGDSSTVNFTGTNSWENHTIDSTVFNMTKYNYIAFYIFSSPENFSVLDKIRFDLIDFTPTTTEPTTSTPTQSTTTTPPESTTTTPPESTTTAPPESTTTAPPESTTTTPPESTTTTPPESTTTAPPESTTTTPPESTTITPTNPTTTSIPTQSTGTTQTTATTPTEPTTTVTSTQSTSTERPTRSSTTISSPTSTYSTFPTVSSSTTEVSSNVDSENFWSFSNAGFIALFASLILIGIGGCILSLFYLERRKRRKEKYLEDTLGPETPYVILPLPSTSNQMSNQSPAAINSTANQLSNYGLTKRQVGGASEIYTRAQNPSSVYSYGTGDYFPRLARGGS